VGPGAKADIRIRGGSSLNASNEPLIVLDGLPLVILLQVELQEYFQRLIQMILNLYNSKDASAAAIYGSRAANGCRNYY
jgi:iron complex outermembrane receptor protein